MNECFIINTMPLDLLAQRRFSGTDLLISITLSHMLILQILYVNNTTHPTGLVQGNQTSQPP